MQDRLLPIEAFRRPEALSAAEDPLVAEAAHPSSHHNEVTHIIFGRITVVVGFLAITREDGDVDGGIVAIEAVVVVVVAVLAGSSHEEEGERNTVSGVSYVHSHSFKYHTTKHQHTA